MLESQYKDTETRMIEAVNKFTKDLAKVRTGHASLSIFDGVSVDYYGTPTPLNQVAGIANPEPNSITIQPWDANLIGPIEKAIFAANLGFTPNNDGSIVRINVPPLTEERRKEYVKAAHQLGESAKTAIRNIRRDANDTFKKQEKDKDISQDQMHTALDEIQKITDRQSKRIDELIKKKEAEILMI